MRLRRPLEPARVWLYHHLPTTLLWHPAEWLLAFMCAVVGVVTLTTPVRSDSLQQLLPETPYRIYGAVLVIGAFALVRGLSSIRRVDFDRYVITRVPAYRLGLRLLALNVSLFVIGLVFYARWGGLLASIFPIAFVGMCLCKLVKLGGPDERR